MPIRLVNRRGKPIINEDGEPIMERVLRPKYGMHGFRHAAASLFIEEGFSPKRVQDLMGHSTIQMTSTRTGTSSSQRQPTIRSRCGGFKPD